MRTDSHVRFDDLLDIRKGGAGLLMGTGDSAVGKLESPAEWRQKADALRGLFLQTLGEAPDLSCPLAPETVAEADRGDYLERRLRYNVAPDERISAYALIPKGLAGKAPAVLCLHPTTPLGKEQAIGNDATEAGQDRAYALHLVKRGYVTFAYDLLGAGERRYEGLDAFDTAPFYVKHPKWSARGKDLWDVGRALDFLQTMDEVDPSRLGSIGHSQGGGVTLQAMAVDERLKVGVSSCGEWPLRLSKNPFNQARAGWWVGRPILRPYCLTGKPFPVDMHEILALAAPRAVMNISALNDCGHSLGEADFARAAFEDMAANVSKVFSLLGAAGNFSNVLHLGGHSFLAAQRELAYAFLDEKLKPSFGART